MIAYDIFEEFNGNHAIEQELKEKFKNNSKVTITYGDHYKVYENMIDESLDVLHIDIANNAMLLTKASTMCRSIPSAIFAMKTVTLAD